MRSAPLSPRFLQAPGGFAIVIVLFLLALILILVIAFAANMRTERKAAHNMAQGQRADLLAEGVLAHAVSLLANNIPDPGDPTIPTPAGTATNWLVNPGRLTLIDSAAPPAVTHIPLYSGPATSTNSLVAVNLNAASPTTGTFPITGTADPMWVSWIPVLQDASAPASNTNQIVGRYAFWMDDESAKINFNTARGKPGTISAAVALPASWSTPGSRDLRAALTPTFAIGSTTYALGQPASVNLDLLGLTPTDIAALDTDVKTNGFFARPQAIQNYAGGSASFYEQNKFQLTPFSRAPEFNVFGKSRIFLHAPESAPWSEDLAQGPIYQYSRSAEQPTTFSGYHAGIGNSTSSPPDGMRQVREPVVRALASLLQRNDWPGMGSRTFRWNLSPLGAAETDQIALNIESMGYLASTKVDTFGTLSLSNAFARWAGIEGAFPGITETPETSFWKGPLTGLPMIPVSPFPHMTEITCRLFPVQVAASSPPTWNLGFDFAIEVYQPPGYFSGPNSTTGVVGFNNGDNDPVRTATGSYQTRIFPSDMSVSVTSATTSRLNIVNRINNSPYRSLLPQTDAVPHDGFFQVRVPPAPYYVGSGTVAVSGTSNPLGRAIFSGSATVHVKARFLLACAGMTRPQQAVPVYLPRTASGPAAARPPSGNDDDAYLDFTFSIPVNPDFVEGYAQSREPIDPRILASKANWPLTSGSLGNENPAAAAFNSGATQWALWNFDGAYGVNSMSSLPAFRGSSIGMFAFVPTGVQRSLPFESLRFHDQTPGAGELPDWLVLDLLAPTFPSPISLRNSTAGKINLNTKIYPENAHFSPPARTAPLDALFQHMPNGSVAAQAIRAYQNSGGYFDYIGRICELPGVADSSLGTTEFEQEVLLRHLASLMTTQSNTFSVWGVAQTVKKSPKNTNYGIFESGDTVTGERRFHAVIERAVWAGREGTPGNALVDGNGRYIAASPNKPAAVPLNPGLSPESPWTGKAWASMDGPHQPDVPTPLGNMPYTSSSLEDADNPLAAAMTYRIIFWEYLD